ncbi:MAG: substrate-binding domain-containing protein [Phycisphaeraceae bacterium JB051]
MSSTVTPNKCHSITRLLATRIDQGMYLNGPIPGERALATELGVSYLTVRRATRQLLDEGVLSRMSNGRLQPSHKTSKTRRGPQIGLLVDTFPVNAMREWFTDLDKLVSEQGGTLHLISYNDKDDPRVFEALDQELDGLFIIYRYELSPLLRDRLVRNAHRLVSLWFDMTSLGIPSIENAPARNVSRAVEYLKDLGHQRVDFLCASDRDAVLRDRIHYWQQAVNHYDLPGEVFEQTPRKPQSSAMSARDLALEMHQQGKLDQVTAMVCATTNMAMGFMRACHEVGRVVGKDISVIGYGEVDAAQVCIPSITSVKPGPRLPLLEQGLEWILSRDKGEGRPMHIDSLDVDLFIGESTASPSC